MPRYEFSLNISKEQLLEYYRGAKHTVTVRLPDGRRLQFPANLLTQHVAYDGVSGWFALKTDEHHKAIALERLRAEA